MIRRASLTRVTDDFLTVFTAENGTNISFPLRRVLSIVEAEKGVSTGVIFRDQFCVVIEVFYVVVCSGAWRVDSAVKPVSFDCHSKNCIFLQSTVSVRLNMSWPTNGQNQQQPPPQTKAQIVAQREQVRMLGIALGNWREAAR